MRVCFISSEDSLWASVTCTLGRKGALHTVFHTTLDSAGFTDCDQVVYSGFLPTAIVRDMTLPAGSRTKDFPAAIEYQFVRTQPLDATASKYWEYVQLSRKQKDAPFPIRAAAVSHTVYQERLEMLNQKGVKIDCFILTPLLFFDELFPGASESFPPTRENIKAYFQNTTNHDFAEFARQCNEHQIVDPTLQINLYMALRFFQTCDAGHALYMCPEMLPDQLRPARCRTLKRINFAFCAVLLLLIGWMAYQHFMQSYQTYSSLVQRNAALDKQVRQLQQETLKINSEIKLLQSYRDLNAGHPDIRPVLREISLKIPSYMWVDSFRFSNDTVELSVKSEKDDINFYGTMQEGNRYKLLNLRKNRGSQEQIQYSVTLKAGNK